MIKNWLQFNEGKNYGNLYHGFTVKGDDIKSDKVSDDVDSKTYETIISILEKGLKFASANFGDGTGNQPMINWYKNADNYGGMDLWKNMRGSYFISTSRNSQWVKNNRVTFVLDGSLISNNYKIHPFDFTAALKIKTIKRVKKTGMGNSPKDIMDYAGKRPDVYEEKIESNKPGYLSSKYITGIILYKPSDDLIKLVQSIDTNLDIKIIK
jgi:hypothetical protein